MVFWDEIIVNALSVLTLIGGIFVVAYVLDLIYGKINGKMLLNGFWKFSEKHALTFTFIVALIAMLGSLTFSELLNFTPCILCWYQRILMYPIALMGLIALVRKKGDAIFSYFVVFAILGALLSGYHYLGQVNVVSDLPCPAIGYSASCSETFFLQFGYITIPMMALTAFLMIIVFWHVRKNKLVD